jgi:hypothetical protein
LGLCPHIRSRCEMRFLAKGGKEDSVLWVVGWAEMPVLGLFSEG